MSLSFAPETIELFSQTGIAQVEQAITPDQRGRVRFGGTSWFARFYDRTGAIVALPGSAVSVVGIEGQTLLVSIAPSLSRSVRPIAGGSEGERSGLLGWVWSLF